MFFFFLLVFGLRPRYSSSHCHAVEQISIDLMNLVCATFLKAASPYEASTHRSHCPCPPIQGTQFAREGGTLCSAVQVHVWEFFHWGQLTWWCSSPTFCVSFHKCFAIAVHSGQLQPNLVILHGVQHWSKVGRISLVSVDTYWSQNWGIKELS